MSIEWKVFKARFKGKRATIVIMLMIGFIIADVGAGMYIANYTSADLPGSEYGLGGDVEGLGPTSSGTVYLLVDGRVISASPNGLTYLWSDVDSFAVGHDTMDVAYVSGGQLTMRQSSSGDSVSVPFEGYTVGVGERWTSDDSVSVFVICVDPSPDNDTVVGFDFLTGSVEWTLPLEADITEYDVNDGSRYLTFADDTGNVTVLNMNGDVESTYALGDVDEVSMALSGTRFATIDGSVVNICFEGDVTSVDIGVVVHSAQFKAYKDDVYVRSENAVYVIEGEGHRQVLAVDGLVGYCVPSVADRMYVTDGLTVSGYRFPREVATWESNTEGDFAWMSTDPSGTALTGVSGSSVMFIDDESPLGDSQLWLVLGSCIIAEILIVSVLLMYDRVRYMRRETLYVVPLGIGICVVFAYLFPSGEAVEWFGSMTSYLLIAASFAAVSVIMGWWSESGFGSVMFAFMASIIASIPIAMAAGFLLSATGYTFTEDSFLLTSLLKSLTTAGWMGAIGGVYSVVAQSLLEW